jgi:hypothetical protein
MMRFTIALPPSFGKKWHDYADIIPQINERFNRIGNDIAFCLYEKKECESSGVVNGWAIWTAACAARQNVRKRGKKKAPVQYRLDRRFLRFCSGRA